MERRETAEKERKEGVVYEQSRGVVYFPVEERETVVKRESTDSGREYPVGSPHFVLVDRLIFVACLVLRVVC